MGSTNKSATTCSHNEKNQPVRNRAIRLDLWDQEFSTEILTKLQYDYRLLLLVAVTHTHSESTQLLTVARLVEIARESGADAISHGTTVICSFHSETDVASSIAD